MKGIYVIFDGITEKDIELIGKARGIFPYVTVAIQHVPILDDDERIDRAEKYLSDISRIRECGKDSVGLSIDFFDEGNFESLLRRNGVAQWVVPRETSAKLVQNIDFPKYFLES